MADLLIAPRPTHRALFEALFAGSWLCSREAFWDGEDRRHWYRYDGSTDQLLVATAGDGKVPRDWDDLGWSMSYCISLDDLFIVDPSAMKFCPRCDEILDGAALHECEVSRG